MDTVIKNLYFPDSDLYFSEIVGKARMVLNSMVKPETGHILAIKLTDYLGPEMIEEGTPLVIQVEVQTLLTDLSDGRLIPWCEPVKQEDSVLLNSMKKYFDSLSEQGQTEEQNFQEIEEFAQEALPGYQDMPVQASPPIRQPQPEYVPQAESEQDGFYIEEVPEEPRRAAPTAGVGFGGQARSRNGRRTVSAEDLQNVPPDLEKVVDSALQYTATQPQAPVDTDRVLFESNNPGLVPQNVGGVNAMRHDGGIDPEPYYNGGGSANDTIIKQRVHEVFNFPAKESRPPQRALPQQTQQRSRDTGSRRIPD